MDTWQFPGDEYLSLLRGFYLQKYQARRFDLIIAQGPPALRFLLKYGDEMFPGTPIVFGTLEKIYLERLKPSLRPNITGVLANLGFGITLEAALRIQPDVKRVVVVSGGSENDLVYLAKAREEFKSFEGRVEFDYLINSPIEEIENQLRTLPDQAIVFYVTFYGDGAGRRFTLVDSMARVAKASRVPTYGVISHFIDAGSIGGFVWGTDADAREVTKVALRILSGEKPADIPVRAADTSRFEFDWRQLRRWGIAEQSLPPGSILRYKEFSFWEQYKWRIVAAAALFVFEAFLILGLWVNRTRLHRAKEESARFAREATAESERLAEVVNNVPGIVWESRIAPGSQTREAVFVSPYVETMLGYTANEWLSKPGFFQSIIVEEDRERVARKMAAILKGDRKGAFHFRWRAKNGQVLWAEAHITALNDERGSGARLHGVTLDVTDRKQGEEAKSHLASIVESSDDAILSKTIAGTITSWNFGAEKMYGYSASEMIGKHVSILAPAELNEEVTGILEQIRRGESLVYLETVRVTKDGRQIDVALTISPIKGENGVIIGASTIGRDITVRKRNEKALRKLTGRVLALQDEEQRRVAAELHDGLGQSLAIIKNRVSICLGDRANQDRVNEQLQEISATATAAIEEVREIPHNLRPYELDRLGLNPAIESMIERVSGATHLTIAASLQPLEGLLSLEAETSVYRIVQEGLNNIVKHSGATEATIRIEKSGPHAVISVQDNGTGMLKRETRNNGDNDKSFGLTGIAEPPVCSAAHSRWTLIPHVVRC